MELDCAPPIIAVVLSDGREIVLDAWPAYQSNDDFFCGPLPSGETQIVIGDKPPTASGRGLSQGDEPITKYRAINNLALANYSQWVPTLFGRKARKTPEGGYRVSSKSLGRDLQEDLSFHADGIKDFGLADQEGETREGNRSPLDTIIEYDQLGQIDLDGAFRWLDEKFGNQISEKFGIPANKPASDEPKASGGKLIQSGAEFVNAFKPPDYLIDGLLQRRFVYSMTGKTGHGKTAVMLRVSAHVALGLPLDGREIESGRVLFFAGENPDDIRMRWIAQCEEMGFHPDGLSVFFLPGTPPISDAEIRKRIDAEAAERGPFALLIVDTSAAYFRGDDENSNAQLGAHARMLRSFVNLPGGPAVVVTSHPPKNPDLENLLPRGGGAFLNEMDGNLVAIGSDLIATVHWHGKFRGPDFAPISFRLTPATTARLVDSKARPIWTVTAAPISEAEKAGMEATGRRRQDELLTALHMQPGLSLADAAEHLQWHLKDGRPNKSLVNRMLGALLKDKLIEKKRGKITLTAAGKKVIGA